MLGWLSRKIGVAATAAPSAPAAAQPARRAAGSVVAYPPLDPGLPPTPLATLTQDQAQLLDMLRMHAALPDALFELRFLQPAQRTAGYVNVLPGSATGVFSGASGLFRAACETALASFRASDGRIFTGEQGVEERHVLEGRWRHVCFLAGLLYPLGRPLASMRVQDEAGHTWHAALEGLTPWCEAGDRRRLYATWLQTQAEPGPCALTATFALDIIGRPNIEWLNEGSTVLLQTLLDIVSGTEGGPENRAASLVKEMWGLVREHEQARLPQHYGQLTVGSDLGPYLLDAVLSLYQSEWSLNRSVAFADHSGIYLQWPQAGAAIRAFCRAQGHAGVPASDGALLSLLASARIIAGDDEMFLCDITNVEGQRLQAVRLARPGLVMQPHETLERVAANWALTRPSAPPSQARASELEQQEPKAAGASVGAAKEAPRLDVLEQAELQEVAQALPGDRTSLPPAQTQGVAVDYRISPPTPLPATASQRSATAKAERPPSTTEGAEVKFRALLPQEVTETLSLVDAEYLGQIVHRWRAQELGQALMRPNEHGFAVDVTLATELARDASKFLQHLADAGWLYTAPQTPRKLFYPVAIADGHAATRDCFILGRHTARKLGLQ